MPMRKYIKYLLLVFLITALFFVVYKRSKNNVPQPSFQTEIPQSIVIETSNFVGESALEATKASVNEIKLEGTGKNAYVTSLNGKVADSKKNEYWELSINNKPSQVGAGSYTIKTGDIITWQIKTF